MATLSFGVSQATDQSRTSSDYIVVSDLFPPAIGGSGELVANIYGRLAEAAPVTVITNGPAPSDRAAVTAACRMKYVTARIGDWGLLRPRAFLHHVTQARRIRSVAAHPAAVVHCARLLPEGTDASFACWRRRPRYACWAHGEELMIIRASRELRWAASQVVRGATLFFANSRNTAAVLREFDVPADRIEVVHPGVDARRFSPGIAGASALRARLAAPGEIVLLCVGRLQRRKGHDLVLQALARPGAPQAARFIIVGDGEERDRLQRMAAELGIAGRVTFTGAVAADELPAYFAAADVFVHPNRIEGKDFEGFGIVFLEAAAAGLPVIAGSTGGAPEAVADGETGLLVSGTDVDELERVLTRLAGDPALRQTLGSDGRARALRDFSWDRATAQVARAHARILAGDFDR